MMQNKMKELDLKEKSSKSLLANVLDMDDDFVPSSSLPHSHLHHQHSTGANSTQPGPGQQKNGGFIRLLYKFNTFTTLSLLLPLYISSVMAQSKKTFKCFALAQRNESLNNFFPSSLSFSVGIYFFLHFYLKRSPILPHVILNTINKIEKKTNINFMAMDGLLLKEFL